MSAILAKGKEVEVIMFTYQFTCEEHGYFEVTQELHSEHKAKCPKCNLYARRIFTVPKWYYDNPKPLYHKNGSYEET